MTTSNSVHVTPLSNKNKHVLKNTIHRGTWENTRRHARRNDRWSGEGKTMVDRFFQESQRVLFLSRARLFSGRVFTKIVLFYFG